MPPFVQQSSLPEASRGSAAPRGTGRASSSSRKQSSSYPGQQNTHRMKHFISDNDLNFFVNEFKKWTKEEQNHYYVHPTKKDVRFTNQGQVMKYILSLHYERQIAENEKLCMAKHDTRTL